MNTIAPEATKPSAFPNTAPPAARQAKSGKWFGKILKLPRMAGSILITLAFRNHTARWQEVAADPTPVWDLRNQAITGFIPAGSSVMDIGCGAQTIKKHLKPGCTYQPCDLVKSTPDVIVCDFNAGLFPRVERHFDFLVCSGVMEYIREPKKFLEALGDYADTVLLSYHPFTSKSSKLKRMASNWVNHFNEGELLQLFSEAGLKTEILHGDENERIYRLQKSVR